MIATSLKPAGNNRAAPGGLGTVRYSRLVPGTDLLAKLLELRRSHAERGEV